MDDAVILPFEERDEAHNHSDQVDMGSNVLAEEQAAAERVLRRSQAYVCFFNGKKRLGFFWSTEEIARRYTQIRNSLVAFSARSREMVGHEATEVHFNRSYSHSSPYIPGGQRELFTQFESKVHAFWMTREDFMEGADTDNIRQLLGVPDDARLDLQWYPMDMVKYHIDFVHAVLRESGAALNPEPFTLPKAAYPFPPNAAVSPELRIQRMQEHREYERQIVAIRGCVMPRDFQKYGALDIVLNADGLVLHRADYPRTRTPILTWKQIRSVIPKGRKRKLPTAIAHNPDAKRKLVIVQRKEE